MSLATPWIPRPLRYSSLTKFLVFRHLRVGGIGRVAQAAVRFGVGGPFHTFGASTLEN